MAPSFEQLPPEIISQIVAHFEVAKTLLSLSLTCKTLNEFVQTDGFRVFVQHRFPSFRTPPYWKDAAHALTTWSRNWDRKAFIARDIEPCREPYSRLSHPLRSRGIQTMGYQPVIDGYEVWVGGNWSSRKEVVAWGAGADLILRLKRTGDEAEIAWQAHMEPDRRSILDQHHHMHDWVTYKEPGLVNGRDDITSTNILRSTNPKDDELEHVLVGRASGRLDRIAINVEGAKTRVVSTYDTGKRPVRSVTVDSSSRPLAAACLADSAVALYGTGSQGTGVEPLAEVSAIPPGRPGRTWSSRFLRHDRLAIGRGPSGEPLLIYGIDGAGFSKSPIRKYGVDVGDREDPLGTEATGSTGARFGPTSIYPIAPIAPSSVAGGAEGDIFLSGGYDGNVRLHDLRSPAPSVALFMDLAENSAIYSLLPLGRERFVAGASRYAMIKVFDLRMSGGKLYFASDLDSCNAKASLKVASAQACHSGRSCCDYHLQTKAVRSNYNIYINDRRSSSRRSSPVYSLSAPSPFSPTFYAGIENAVVQFDVVSALDRHPDPLFTHGLKRTGTKPEEIMRKWDPQKDAMALRLYEQIAGSAKMRTQRGLHLPLARTGEKGWDERWQ